MSLEKFAHLWDGNEKGWTLQYIERCDWTITFHFAAEGPTIQEVSQLRGLLDKFRDLPMEDVWKHLRGKTSHVLQDSLTNLQAKLLAEKAKTLGLGVTSHAINRSGYVPVDSDGCGVLIEDERISDEVVRRMLAAGVPVERVHVD